MRVFCSDHNKKQCEFYCNQDKMPLCGQCVLSHSDHKQGIKKLEVTDLMPELEAQEEGLIEQSAKINSLLDWIRFTKNQEKDILTSDYFDNLKTIKQINSKLGA